MIKVVLFDADGVLVTGTMFGTYLKTYLGLDEDIIQQFFDNEFKSARRDNRISKMNCPNTSNDGDGKKSVSDFS